MSDKLKFLFVPVDAVGGINPFIGIGQQLVLKGHAVYFVVSNSWKGKLEGYGFIEKFYQSESKEEVSVDAWGEIVQAMSPALAMSPLQKLEQFIPSLLRQSIAGTIEADTKLRQIISEVQPDLIAGDIIHNPAISDAGVPWACVCSINPVGFTMENVPPAFSGYSVRGDKSLWKNYRDKYQETIGPVFKTFNDWIVEKGGYEIISDGISIWTNPSPYANLYMFPEELNYTMYRRDPPKFYHFDCFMRSESENFKIPDKIKSGPGKIVYFSLGTIGSFELGLMKKIIAILAKSPNRFIISKGLLGEQLEVADNMWGANMLPQTNVLPLVDLVITHGGNNTVTEAFYFGKKIIVLPLFGDQHDTAQRVEDTGLGLQFQPYKMTQDELLDGIEMLLKDNLLENRMKTISHRIQSSSNQLCAAELLVNVARNVVISRK